MHRNYQKSLMHVKQIMNWRTLPEPTYCNKMGTDFATLDVMTGFKISEASKIEDQDKTVSGSKTPPPPLTARDEGCANSSFQGANHFFTDRAMLLATN